MVRMALMTRTPHAPFPARAASPAAAASWEDQRALDPVEANWAASAVEAGMELLGQGRVEDLEAE